MTNVVTFLVSVFLAVESICGLHCYYCLPCDGTNMQRVTCEPAQTLCSYIEGFDPFGEYRLIRVCVSPVLVAPSSCLELEFYFGLRNVQGCFCDTNFCNVDVSIRNFAVDMDLTDLERRVAFRLYSVGTGVLPMNWLLLLISQGVYYFIIFLFYYSAAVLELA